MHVATELDLQVGAGDICNVDGHHGHHGHDGHDGRAAAHLFHAAAVAEQHGMMFALRASPLALIDFDNGLLDDAGRRLRAAQLVGGLATALIASVPVFLLGPDGIRVLEFLLLAFLAVTGYRAARSVPTSRTRSIAHVGFLVLVLLAVLFVKSLVGH